jgi:hypothetical protein
MALRAVALVMLLLYAACVIPFGVARAPGWLPDAHAYLLMAEALSPWTAEPSPAAHYALETSVFPPLYPLLLGLLGGGDAAWGRAVSILCLLASLVALYGWMRARGWEQGGALLAVAAFAVLPVTLLQALEGLSEPTYLLASALCLRWVERAERGPPGLRRRRLAAAAGMAGLALATRYAGFSLVGALGIWLWVRREPRRFGLMALCLAPIGAWWLAGLWIGVSGSYLGQLRGFNPDLMTALPAAVRAQLLSFGPTWSRLFVLSHQPGLLVHLLAATLGLLSLGGLVQRMRRLEPDALYAVAYLGMIALWAFPAHLSRLLWPLVPVLLVFAAEAAAGLAARAGARMAPLGRAVVLLVVLGLALPSVPVFVGRFRASREVDFVAFTHTPRWYLADEPGARMDARGRRQLARAMRAVGQIVPATECVYAVEPVELMWWSGRASRRPPPPSVADPDFAAASADCPWFFLSPVSIAPYREPYYPSQRLGDGAQTLVLPRSGREEGLPPAALARLSGPPSHR